jgi:hypothetical protein
LGRKKIGQKQYPKTSNTKVVLGILRKGDTKAEMPSG